MAAAIRVGKEERERRAGGDEGKCKCADDGSAAKVRTVRNGDEVRR